jgi:hypothetical protein
MFMQEETNYSKIKESNFDALQRNQSLYLLNAIQHMYFEREASQRSETSIQFIKTFEFALGPIAKLFSKF